MNKQEQLFNLIEEKGEIMEGDIHIIDTTEHIGEGEKTFRIYHKDGYCFDVSKYIKEENEETEEAISFDYSFYSEWEGFDKLTIDNAIKIFIEWKKQTRFSYHISKIKT
jgi:hypothetical protein